MITIFEHYNNLSKLKLGEWVLLNSEQFEISYDDDFVKFIAKTPAKFIRTWTNNSSLPKYVFEFLNKPDDVIRNKYSTLWRYIKKDNIIYIWMSKISSKVWIDYHNKDINLVKVRIETNKYNL